MGKTFRRIMDRSVLENKPFDKTDTKEAKQWYHFHTDHIYIRHCFPVEYRRRLHIKNRRKNKHLLYSSFKYDLFDEYLDEPMIRIAKWFTVNNK